jgi:hypothetical protein
MRRKIGGSNLAASIQRGDSTPRLFYSHAPRDPDKDAVANSAKKLENTAGRYNESVC